jgi:hypothetical protein
MNSLQRRLAAIEAAIKQEQESVIDEPLIIVFTLAEHLAIEKYREQNPRPPIERQPGLKTLSLTSINAHDWLAERGIDPPAWTDDDKQFYGLDCQHTTTDNTL